MLVPGKEMTPAVLLDLSAQLLVRAVPASFQLKCKRLANLASAQLSGQPAEKGFPPALNVELSCFLEP